MRPLALLSPVLAAGLLTGAAQAQDDQQAEMKAKYEEKIQKEFVAYGGWELDYDKAVERAKSEGKLLFTYFSRSYAP
jgi:hypothetical protein